MRELLAPRPGDHTPLYLQLARSLRYHIAKGEIDPGSALPSERDLSELTGLSRVTVRKGIEKLIEEGVLFRWLSPDGSPAPLNGPKSSSLHR